MQFRHTISSAASVVVVFGAGPKTCEQSRTMDCRVMLRYNITHVFVSDTIIIYAYHHYHFTFGARRINNTERVSRSGRSFRGVERRFVRVQILENQFVVCWCSTVVLRRRLKVCGLKNASSVKNVMCVNKVLHEIIKMIKKKPYSDTYIDDLNEIEDCSVVIRILITFISKLDNRANKDTIL